MPLSFLTRYCTIASVSAFVGAVMAPLLVMPSELNPTPPLVLSVVSDALVCAAVESSVKSISWVSLALPALSVWRTCTLYTPSAVPSVTGAL